jgi:hypothetical protein
MLTGASPRRPLDRGPCALGLAAGQGRAGDPHSRRPDMERPQRSGCTSDPLSGGLGGVVQAAWLVPEVERRQLRHAKNAPVRRIQLRKLSDAQERLHHVQWRAEPFVRAGAVTEMRRGLSNIGADGWAGLDVQAKWR